MRKFTRLFILAESILMLALNWYLVCTNRPIWRAQIGIVISVLVCSLYFYLENEQPQVRLMSKKWISAFMWVLCLMLVGSNTYILYRNYRDVKHSDIVENPGNIIGRLDHLYENPDAIYVTADYFVTGNVYDLTAANYRNLFHNYIFLGNWMVPSPVVDYWQQENNVSNPIENLLDDREIYLYGSEETAQRIKNYLEEKNNCTIKIEEQEDSVWDFSVL